MKLLRGLSIFVSCIGALASSSVAADVMDELATVPAPAERVRQIDAGLRTQFDAALADYDQRIERAPHDVPAAVARCKFIVAFYAEYEYSDFVDSIDNEGTACSEELERRRPDHPEVVLMKLERIYGDERLESALAVLPNVDANRWTVGQKARLYVVLAAAAELMDDERSFEFARTALRYDEAADVRMIVATELVARGDKEGVVQVLMSPSDRHDPKDVWYLIKKLGLLADVDAREPAMEVYAALRTRKSFDTMEVVSALRKIGAIAEAREALSKLTEDEFTMQRIARERFLFELEYGDPAQALGAYDTWRDAGWSEDPLAINRVALFARAPFLQWQARDLLGLVALLGVLAGVALLASLPVAAIHYRGLARRARTGDSYPYEGWMLRHAWFALFAFSAASLFAMYCVGPLDVNAVDGRLWGLDATPDQIARITIVSDLLVVLLMVPLAILARRRQAQWWSTQWSPFVSVCVGAAVALVLRAPLLLTALTRDGDIAPGATQQLLWQVLEAVRDTFGIASALWLVVVVAPIVEEFIFRAVLLRAFAAHIRFAWANVLQAALFSLMHFDAAAAPILFAVGLIAGYLARRSGGLLAPIAMHFVFNLIVALAMMF